jgi:hypothetical protein
VCEKHEKKADPDPDNQPLHVLSSVDRNLGWIRDRHFREEL